MTYTDVLADVFETTAQYHRLPNGELEKQGHLLSSIAHFQNHYPLEYAEFEMDGLMRQWKVLHNKWIREHKGNPTGNPAVDDLRDYVQLSFLPGIPCIRRRHMLRRHVVAERDYHNRIIRGHRRTVEWDDDVLARMDAIGLINDDAPIEPVLSDAERAAWQ